MPLVFVLTVWTACESFSSQIHQEIKRQKLSKKQTSLIILYRGKRRLKWTEIYIAYKRIRELCQLVNSCVGSLLTSFIASCIFTQAAGIDSMMDMQDITIQLRIAFLLIVTTCTYTLAADACHKVGYFYNIDNNLKKC